jgi:peptidoglycan biosynthesis protein MviN/MurJ (putative lipid II flippase)
VNTLLNLFLIPWLGALGAALATLLAYLAMLLALYVWIEKAYPVHYPWVRLAVSAALMCADLVVVNSLNPGNPIVALVLRCGLSVVVFAALCSVLLFTPGERALVVNQVRALVRRRDATATGGPGKAS